jgi:hypothetical protein
MKKILIRTTLFCVVLASAFSCSKQIDDAYQNPNAPVRVPVETLLPNLIASMAGNYAGHGTMNDTRYIGAYVQNFQFYLPLSVYDQMGYTNNSADIGQSTWRMHYYDIGQNNMKMIEWAKEEKKWDYAGVGQAIFAWSWMTMTDYYGDIILDESFRTENITFKYNTQEEVYTHVRKLCFESLENLNKTGDGVSQANLAKGDAFFYNGDVNKWKKFVYGVLARYYNHQSNKSTYKADSVIYYTNLSLATTDDNGLVKFTANSLSATNNFFGPFRGNLTGTGTTAPTAIRQGAYIANLMNGTNSEFAGVQDPRAWYMLRGNTNGTIKGVAANKGQSVITANDRPENFWGVSQVLASNLAPATDANCRYIFRNSAPFPILTASEIQFMKAEAAFRKGDKATAYQAYKDGISASFDMLSTTYNVNIPVGKEITPANKLAYMSNTAVVPATSAGLTLTKIMLQKYIAMFAHGSLETWMDLRRFHYSDLDAQTGAQVYKDFVVPTAGDLYIDNQGLTVQRVRPRFNSEYVWNILELQRIGATGLDYHTKKLWVTEP